MKEICAILWNALLSLVRFPDFVQSQLHLMHMLRVKLTVGQD